MTQRFLLRSYFREENFVGVIVEEDFKRWTAKRKAALVTEILQGKTSVSEAARSFDLSPSEIEDWVDEGKKVWRTPFGLNL
jgi:transposase-like protein